MKTRWTYALEVRQTSKANWMVKSYHADRKEALMEAVKTIPGYEFRVTRMVTKS